MADILTWDKSIDLDVKTTDHKKVGKIRAVTNDFIQIRKGSLDRKYYFVPKYYFHGYDGDNIWLSITEDEEKQFESEKELSISNFDNEDYQKRKLLVEKQYPHFSSAIPSFSGSDSSPAKNQVGMAWDKVIGKEIRSADDKDLGEVESVATGWIEAKKGKLDKKHYYIPKTYVEEYDGKKLHTSLTKDEVKDRFERDSPPLPEEFKTQEYQDLSKVKESKYPQYRELIPLMAKEPRLEIRREQSGES